MWSFPIHDRPEEPKLEEIKEDVEMTPHKVGPNASLEPKKELLDLVGQFEA